MMIEIEDVVVMQEDREAQAALYEAVGKPGMAEEIRNGDHDDHSGVQAFARHRIDSINALFAAQDLDDLWDDRVTDLVDRAFAHVSRNPSDHETAIAYRRAILAALTNRPIPTAAEQSIGSKATSFLSNYVQEEVAEYFTRAAKWRNAQWDACIDPKKAEAAADFLSRPTRAIQWNPMSTAPYDGSEILLLAHGMVIQARYSGGEWSASTPASPAEYWGAVWVAFDDALQFEIEEGAGEDGIDLHGQVTGWLPLSALPSRVNEPIP